MGASPAAGQSEVAPAKWNPGHYSFVHSSDAFDKIYDQPHFKGAKKRYYWDSLEKEKDVYDFSEIEADLNVLQAHGKRLVLMLQDKGFGGGKTRVPAYLLNEPAYGGGVEPYTKGGYTVRIWDPVVLARENALLTALAKRFDDEPFFEAVVFPETAVAIDKQKAIGYTPEAYFQALKDRMTHAKKVFRRSNVLQYANWLGNPPDGLQQIFEHAYQIGAGIGGPDVVPDNAPGRSQRGRVKAYDLYPQYAGKIPMGTDVQTPSLGGKEGTFTPKELFDMGIDTLKLNYMFYMAVEAPRYTPGFSTEWVPYVNSQSGRVNAQMPENLKAIGSGE
jgi:hypothetical protein